MEAPKYLKKLALQFSILQVSWLFDAWLIVFKNGDRVSRKYKINRFFLKIALIHFYVVKIIWIKCNTLFSGNFLFLRIGWLKIFVENKFNMVLNLTCKHIDACFMTSDNIPVSLHEQQTSIYSFLAEMDGFGRLWTTMLIIKGNNFCEIRKHKNIFYEKNNFLLFNCDINLFCICFISLCL